MTFRPFLWLCSSLFLVATTAHAEERFAESIRSFEQNIADGTSKPGSIMFLGSSSIRLWDLEKWFPGYPTINHGFGGSEISDSIHYFDRIVAPLKPVQIVFYAGDNDIAKGKSADVVHRDFKTFVGMLHERHPKTQLAYIAIKPSTKRWNLSKEMAKANALIAETCQTDELLTYVDIWTPMLGKDGRPRPELFVEDGLHLNEAGYKLWSGIVRELLPVVKPEEVDAAANDESKRSEKAQ